MKNLRRFGSWLWFRKFVIGVVIGAILFTVLIVGYKDQNDENARQNERLTQVVDDLSQVVTEQEELRVANDKASCESGNTLKMTLAETFRNVVTALIAASNNPEEAAATFVPPLEEQLKKLVPRDCDAVDNGVAEPLAPALGYN